NWSLQGFYRQIKTIGEENVPKEGPVIACSTHSNMIVDPAILAYTFPHKRKVHFWAKNSLFKNPHVAKILKSSGVVPVDRTTKNNKTLFASTFEVLKLGEVVAVFPEGTSHSGSKLLDLKDGASWAALEYAKCIYEPSGSDDDSCDAKQQTAPAPVVICPLGITYVQKSKYRSLVVAEYGPPIDVTQYLEDFLKDARTTVKRLTKHIEAEMFKLTINASDWEIMKAAVMSRQLLFSDDRDVALEDFVKITQCLVNFYSTDSADNLDKLKSRLNQYKTTLDDLSLSDSDIARYQERDINIPGAGYTLFAHVLKCIIQLPFFLPGLAFHWPIYVMGKLSAKYEKYEESRAQNKILLGLLWLILSYTIMFFAVWLLLFFTPLGVVLAGAVVFIFAWYHVILVDSHYDTFKDVISSYRLLAALASGKGSKPHEQVEGLVQARRQCLHDLSNVCDKYASKSDDLRYVMDYYNRVRSEKL
ncbi:4883_t:CDS:2, partial [Paraglomus occultum]